MEKIKTLFRQQIWSELIQRIMHPNRLVKMAGLCGLELVEYCEEMGF
jgi:hypothetical protein